MYSFDYITNLLANQQREPQSAGSTCFRYIKLFSTLLFSRFSQNNSQQSQAQCSFSAKTSMSTSNSSQRKHEQEESTATMFKPELDWLFFPYLTICFCLAFECKQRLMPMRLKCLFTLERVFVWSMGRNIENQLSALTILAPSHV